MWLHNKWTHTYLRSCFRPRAARMIGNNSIVFDSFLERQLEIENRKVSKSLQDGRIVDISHLPPGLDRSQLELIMKNL